MVACCLFVAFAGGCWWLRLFVVAIVAVDCALFAIAVGCDLRVGVGLSILWSTAHSV